VGGTTDPHPAGATCTDVVHTLEPVLVLATGPLARRGLVAMVRSSGLPITETTTARLSIGEPGTSGAAIHIVVDVDSVQVLISTAPSGELLPAILSLLRSALLALRPDPSPAVQMPPPP
jgi:hypothetical protein